MTDLTLSRDRLTLLLNALWDVGERRFEVCHPSDEVDALVDVELGEPDGCEVRFVRDVESYDAARNDVGLEHGDVPRGDLPKPRDYAACFLASGVVEAANHDEVAEFLEREGRAMLHEGHEPVFAGFDTNVVPWRLHCAFDMHPEAEDRPLVNGFALASGVRRELDWDYKNDESRTRALVDAFGDDFRRQLNQPGGARRVGRLGAAEYSRLLNLGHGEEI